MQTLPETHSEVCKQRFTVYTKEAGPASGSPGSLGSIERPLGGICCWQNQPFRPPGLKEPVKQNRPFRPPGPKELVKQNQPFRPPGLKELVKQNRPFRPPAKTLGERVNASP